MNKILQINKLLAEFERGKSDHILNEIEIDYLCRLCLIEINADDSYDIHSTVCFAEEDNGAGQPNENLIRNIVEHIICVSMDETATMPRRICKSCLDNAWKSFLFKSQSIEADTALRKYLNMQSERRIEHDNVIKLEIEVESHSSTDMIDLQIDAIPTNTIELPENDIGQSDSNSERSPDADNDKNGLNLQTAIEESLNCNNCSEMFANSNDLKIHQKRAHQSASKVSKNSGKAFICNVCNKAFSLPQTLSRHAKLHESLSKNKQCSYCGKCFNRTDDLRRHIRIHTGTSHQNT